MADDNVKIATKHCPACKQDIPVANFDLHTTHCKRFLTPCPQCGDSVHKNLLEEHIDENHAKVKCDVCGDKLEKMELDDHKTSSCKKRNVNCKYCEIILPACDIDEHQESCGSRTEECENCKRRILVKDLDDHNGCLTPVKTSIKVGQNQQNDQIPERLIGGDNDRSLCMGFGFPIHPQFQRYPRAKEERVDPLSGYKTFDYLNNDPPIISRPIRQMIQNRFTPETPVTTFNTSQRTRSDNSFKQSSVSVQSTTSENRVPVFRNERRSEESRPKELPQKYGLSSSDSDSSDDTMAAFVDKKPFPDLTDETLLPCEFCNEMFPADSLGFHQANCDDVPATPRTFSPPKLKRLSLDPFPGGAAAATFSPDIGEGSAPCEFCLTSFPLVHLALHQISCEQNPNIQITNKSETHGRTSPEPKSRFVNNDTLNSSKLFDSSEPRTPLKSNDSDSLRSLVPPSRSRPKASMRSSTNIQAREKRTLAANFSGLVPKQLAETASPSESTTKPSFNETTSKTNDLERKPQQNKRKSKRIPRRNNFPKTFKEVNTLGGDKQTDEWSSNSRDPIRNLSGPHLSPFINSNDHGAPDFGKYDGQRNPQSSKSVGSNLAANTRRNNQRARGHNSTRGQYPTCTQYSTRGHYSNRGQYSNRANNRTRGRSRGSNTFTIQPRRVNNPRQVSGINNEERDVSSQSDFSLQGRPPGFDRQRGSGQRLGSGNSHSRPGQSRLLPPTENSYD